MSPTDYSSPAAYGDALIAHHGTRVAATWLTEFGYGSTIGCMTAAVLERPERIHRELSQHGKRLAESAQMQRAPVGRASVIR